MNTDTGRIYDPDEYQARNRAARRREKIDAHQAEFEAAQAAGKIVPISETVARHVKTGQRVEDRRRQRKAAKAARKKNR